MANNYYKRSDVIDRKYYRIPNYVNLDFSDIAGREIQLREGDRLDIIVERLYGTSPENWRAIALYNDLPYFFDATPGKIIRLPYNIQDVLDRI